MSLLKRGGVPQGSAQGFEGGLGLRWYFLPQMLHLVNPAPNPSGPRPYPIHGFDQPKGRWQAPLGGELPYDTT